MPLCLLTALETMIKNRVWPLKTVFDGFMPLLPTTLPDAVQFGKGSWLHCGHETCAAACSEQEVSVKFEGPGSLWEDSSSSSQTTLHASLTWSEIKLKWILWGCSKVEKYSDMRIPQVCMKKAKVDVARATTVVML